MSILFTENQKRQKEIEQLFSGRESLSAEDFYRKYFATTGVPEDIVCRVRYVLERVLDTDLSALSSYDDFSQNLSFFFDFDSLADVEIVDELEKEFEIQISDSEAENSITIRDIVELVWNKLKDAKA